MTLRRSPQKRWKVLLTSRRGVKSPIPAAKYKETVRAILALPPFGDLPEEFSEVSVLLCGDAEIHELNRSYRKKDKATDVLSFPQEEQWSEGLSSPSLGDLVISIDTANRQAKRFRWTLRQEILRLTIHGLLHLAGYDHEKVSAAKAQKMRRAERSIAAALTRQALR